MRHSKLWVCERGTINFVNERYTKWVPFLSKKVYNGVLGGQTSGQSLGPTDIAANIWHYNNEL